MRACRPAAAPAEEDVGADGGADGNQSGYISSVLIQVWDSCARAGLLPHRRKKTWELMEALTGPGSPRSPRGRHVPTGSLGSRDSLFADEGMAQPRAPARPARCTRSAGALAARVMHHW